MLLISLLAMAVSILVASCLQGFHLPWEKSAEKVFRKVASFSNIEFDDFSTASLITRSTNDIQQVQMFLVMLLRMVLCTYSRNRRGDQGPQYRYFHGLDSSSRGYGGAYFGDSPVYRSHSPF